MAISNLDSNAYPDEDECGLTKRELIAALVVQALCALPDTGPHFTPPAMAEEACLIADALLAELSKGKPDAT